MIRNYAKMRAREPMLINVNEGIATGDVVRVFNDRGEILVGMLATHHPKVRHRHLQRYMLRP
ncbi:hypothetical protein [Campylobacter concisus]